jgi:AcrR family transcriptional regulator
MNFKIFCKQHKPTEKQLFSEFYDIFADEIKIKNKRIATEKLILIINATFKLSASAGFANMTLRQLSNETHISMGGLYAYIQNKEQLALFIHRFLNYYVEKTLNQVNQSNPETALENLITTHIYISDILQPWFFFAFMESKNLSQQHKRYAIKSELMMENRLIDVIKQGQELEIYSQILTAESIAAHIKPLLHDWYLKRWKYQQRKIKVDDFCFSVMIFINRGLTSPHALNENGQLIIDN